MGFEPTPLRTRRIGFVVIASNSLDLPGKEPRLLLLPARAREASPCVFLTLNRAPFFEEELFSRMGGRG